VNIKELYEKLKAREITREQVLDNCEDIIKSAVKEMDAMRKHMYAMQEHMAKQTAAMATAQQRAAPGSLMSSFGIPSPGAIITVEHGATQTQTLPKAPTPRLDAIEQRLAGIEEELQNQRRILTELQDWINEPPEEPEETGE
jgi:uncharacterized coiled-coil protein SlyX